MPISRSEFLATIAAAGAGALLTPATRAFQSPPPAAAALLDSQRFRAAVIAGDVAAVMRFLAVDPALRYGNDDAGRSVFILAHLHGHPEIAELFTELGLELDLVEATIVGDWKRVEQLANGAPALVNADHPIGGTAMYAAALFGHGVPMFRLNFAGGDPNANPRGADGITPARAAMNCREPFGVERAAIYLIGNGGNVNAPQKDGDSVLHGAVRTGNPYLVRYLIRKGGDVDGRNSDGQRPLDLAEALERDELVELLTHHDRIPRDMPRDDPAASRLAYDANGAPYRRPDMSGRPAALLSRIVGVSHGNFDSVRELVGAYPDLIHAAATTEEMAVEASAHMAPMTDSVRFFIDHGAPLSLPTCLRTGMADRARELLREEPRRIRERGPHDFALTYYPSIGGGDVETAQVLVDLGVDVNMEGQLGQTGLHWAARAGQLELTEFWLDNGADIDARLRSSHPHTPDATPLDFARNAKRERVVRLLEARGAG